MADSREAAHVRIVEAAKRLQVRGFFEHSDCADLATNRDMCAMRLALAQLSEGAAPQQASEGAPVWSRTKPTHPGVYGVRGFNLGRDPEDQFEAIVSVRLVDGELLCNLHESTSEDDFERWSRVVEDNSDSFEWCEFVPGTEPQQASAPVGVEGLLAEAVEVGTLCNLAVEATLDAGLVATADALSKGALTITRLAKALAQQPAAELYRCTACDDHYRVGTPCDCKVQPGHPSHAPGGQQPAAVEPDTFFLIRCPGWPAGLPMRSMDAALDYVRRFGDEKTRIATWRHQAGRRDYTPEETRALAGQQQGGTP